MELPDPNALAEQARADLHRVWPWALAALALALIVFFLAPHQLQLLVWALLKLSVGGYLGYVLDRNLFPYARPDRIADYLTALGAAASDKLPELIARAASAAMLRRAIIVAGCLLAIGWGQ